jgi:hypothetical protein
VFQVDRPLLRRDLGVLPRLLAASLHSALPTPLKLMVSREVLTRELSQACSRLEESSDADLAALIDALGQELGALRGARQAIDGVYVAAHPGLPAALDRVVRRLG